MAVALAFPYLKIVDELSEGFSDDPPVPNVLFGSVLLG
jgi:hypothetical protein